MSETPVQYKSRGPADAVQLLPCPFCGAACRTDKDCDGWPTIVCSNVACYATVLFANVDGRDMSGKCDWSDTVRLFNGRSEPRAEGVEGAEAPLVTTIRWTRVEDGLPPYGVTVVVWVKALDLVVRALRDDDYPTMWRIAGSAVGGIRNDLVTAWSALPNGPLPPPDNGGAA